MIVMLVSVVLLIGATALFVFSKAYMLAPYRIGWLMLLANVVYETLSIKLKIRRVLFDSILFGGAVIGSLILAGSMAALVVATVLGAVWVFALHTELIWRSDRPASQLKQSDGKVPLPIPRLIINIRGPVLERKKDAYAAGCMVDGQKQMYELIVLNPGTVRPQLPLGVSVKSACSSFVVEYAGSEVTKCPEPGQVVTLRFDVKAVTAGEGGDVLVSVSHGDWRWDRKIQISSVIPKDQSRVSSAKIEKWKYGANAGFVWRGDNDLYDPSTFQSVDGLKIALGLAGRFRMPTTIMLSTRLSLDAEEHKTFCDHYGWDRHSEEIPGFIEFLKNDVDKREDQEFPIESTQPYSAEIGNHCHLHYGTHAAAAPENHWKSHARMGDGTFPWMTNPGDSFSEQRDNIKKCMDEIEQEVGVRTTCFTIPSDVYDKHTSRAAEAAGIEVGNETDMSKIKKLLVFPAEHHPKGCVHLAEMTRMLPRDPVNAPQIAMLKFWMSFARRNKRTLVYLAHHHLVMYQSNACYSLTAELLRHVLQDTEGDVYPATLTGAGRYWRDVLSPKTRKIQITIQDGKATVTNSANRGLTGIPVDLVFNDGSRQVQLVDIPCGQSIIIDME